MTRDEAVAMLDEWWFYRRDVSLSGTATSGTRANALRERIIDAMTGEDRTEPLAGNAR